MSSARHALPILLLAAAMLSFAPAPRAQPQLPFNPTLISDVAEKVLPAVVNITTRRGRSSAEELRMHEIYDRFRRGTPAPIMGAGSGVVISAKGDIVTNTHVVEEADEILVTFADKRELKATLVGIDKPSDLAFLKVEAKDLPFLALGDSSLLRLGEIVLAVGNPFGVGQTVTMGIVSAKGRANLGIVDYEDFIQTDASINPGNSGGALVNLKGELVGINTAILSRTGNAAGIGFAVPSNMVGPIQEQIADHGNVRRGWLGVEIGDLTPEIVKSLGLKDTRGVLVQGVLDGGPADKAHIEVFDVILSLNDKATKSAAELRNSIALTKPGSKAKVHLVREGKEKDTYVLLDEKKEDSIGANHSLLSGLAIEDLDAEWRKKLSVPAKISGAVVTAVEPGSLAERAGLEPGDVITEVGRSNVKGAAEVAGLAGKEQKQVLMRVYKRGVHTLIVLGR